MGDEKAYSVKKPKFNFPEKIELFFAISLAFLLFWFDVLQNKIIDKGANVVVQFYSGFSMKASVLIWIVFISFLSFQLALLYRNVWYKTKPHHFDYAFSLLASIANILLIVGFLSDINLAIGARADYFFNLVPIDIYHLGIGLEIITVFYFAFTK